MHAQNLMSVADVDGDGLIDYNEFVVRRGGGWSREGLVVRRTWAIAACVRVWGGLARTLVLLLLRSSDPKR